LPGGAPIALPDDDTARRLLRDAMGPSPWWCQCDAVYGAQFHWREAGADGFMALVDGAGEARLVLPMYSRFQFVEPGRLLIWNQPYVDPSHHSPITVRLLDLASLRRLEGVDKWVATKPRHEHPYFDAAGLIAKAEISAGYPVGTHALELPPAFGELPEFFIVTGNSTLPTGLDRSATCISVVSPAAGTTEVLPQDWFNNGGFDYGYQWLTSAVRDPVSRRLIVRGIRLPDAILDETGRRIERALPFAWG
jgi:hypothetical protein